MDTQKIHSLLASSSQKPRSRQPTARISRRLSLVPLALFPKARDTASVDNRKDQTPFAFTATATIKECTPMKTIRPTTARNAAFLIIVSLTAYLYSP